MHFIKYLLNKSVNEVHSIMPDMQYYWLIITIKFKSLINSKNIYLDIIINRSIPVSVKFKMGLRESNLLFLHTTITYL